MKSLWKTILNGSTYTDLAGKRQPRVYVIVTGLLLLLLFITGGMAALNRHLVMRKVQATPLAVDLPTQTTEPPAMEMAGSESKKRDAVSGCPTDAADWSFTPTLISNTYLVIQPACVYQGLEKTIAWALAIREGYSRAEAARILGFSDLPMKQLETVSIPGNADDLVDVPVSFIPPDPNLMEWRLNADDSAAVTYALRGCFETSSVRGNRLEIWGGDYPVICLVVEDAENSHIIYSLDGHTYTSAAKPMRSFLLFGYEEGNDTWMWLGTQTEPKMEITDPVANANERLTVATLYDSQPWDTEWLNLVHHLLMQPPPENWRDMTAEEDRQYILSMLSEAQP